MAVKKKSKKKNTLMLAGAVVLLLITGIVLYITYFTSPEVDSTSGALQNRVVTMPTEFNTSVLENAMTLQLQQFGPEEVQVQNRGRKTDPFAPF